MAWTKEHRRKYKAIWQKENRERERCKALQRKYGITLDDYEDMLVRQNHKCAICGTKEAGGIHSTFNVDHNHDTNTVRGLLCHHCNTSLGGFRDSIGMLKRAIRYLEKHQ